MAEAILIISTRFSAFLPPVPNSFAFFASRQLGRPCAFNPRPLHVCALWQFAQPHFPLLKRLQVTDRLFDPPEDFPTRRDGGDLDHCDHPYYCSRCTKPTLKFLHDNLFCRICGPLGDDVCMGLDSHRKDRFLPFVDRRVLVNAIMKFLESGRENLVPLPQRGRHE